MSSRKSVSVGYSTTNSAQRLDGGGEAASKNSRTNRLRFSSKYVPDGSPLIRSIECQLIHTRCTITVILEICSLSRAHASNSARSSYTVRTSRSRAPHARMRQGTVSTIHVRTCVLEPLVQHILSATNHPCRMLKQIYLIMLHAYRTVESPSCGRQCGLGSHGIA